MDSNHESRNPALDYQLDSGQQPFDPLLVGGDYVNGLRLYYGYYGEIASQITVFRIDRTRFNKWYDTFLEPQVLSRHYKERHTFHDPKPFFSDIFFLLPDKIILELEQGTANIFFNSPAELKAKNLADLLKKYARLPKQNSKELNLVIGGKDGLYTRGLALSKPKLKLDTHYNDDFAVVHKEIKSELNKPDISGLVLLHGLPGTGKSTYIRYLLHHIKKPVIYLPSRLASQLDSPTLIPFLVDNQKSIFVIEDAEDLVMTRDASPNSAISMILNLTDGLLGHGLGIHFIITFNTPVQKIDRALLRKGRLIAKYEFGRLSENNVIELAKELHINLGNKIKPMTLAELYNHDKQFYGSQNEIKKVGFRLQT